VIVAGCGDSTEVGELADISWTGTDTAGSGDDTGATDDTGVDDTTDTDGTDTDSTDTTDTGPDDTGDETVDTGETSDTGDPEGCAADECDIDGACYAHEEANPENACEVCLVVVDTGKWTFDDTATCDDADACSAVDVCVDGECVGTEWTACADGNLCTDDTCDAASGDCAAVPNTAPCDDGNVCTEGSACADGACQLGQPTLNCDDGNSCTIDTCDAKAGCGTVPTADGEACDDGDDCTVDTVCAAGMCKGTPRDCDDKDICTVDTCWPGVQCVNKSLAELCTDNNPCTDETCDAEKGCVYPFNQVSCDDGNACTAGDTCTLGACLGAGVDFNDGNLCTDDACDPAIGPVHVNNAAACDDGNQCTLGDVCADAACTSGPESLPCTDGNKCTNDSCEPAEGCVFENNKFPCDDGSVCTQTDTCADGDCVGGNFVVCDDGNACTLDVCHAEAGCLSSLITSNACRPQIVVDYPPRAATIEGDPGSQVVTVTGTVTSGAGPIGKFTVNGDNVVLSNGAFTVDVIPQVGGNTLVFEAADSFGTERKRVQSYLWTSTYYKPVLEQPKSGMVDPGVGIWLSKAVINKLSAALQPLVASVNLGSAISNPVYSANNYKVSVKNLKHDAPTLALSPQPGGLKMTVTITNIKADIDAPGKCEVCTPFGCADLCPDFTGKLTASKVTATSDVVLTVVNNALKATLKNTKVTIDGADVDINGALGFIIDPVLDIVVDQIIGDLEKSIAGSVADAIEPQIESALSSLAFESEFDMPSLDPAGGTVPIQMKTDFSSVAFDTTGGAIKLRAGAYSPKKTPYSNSGSLARIGCNVGPQLMIVPKADPFELILTDDFTNELLYATWNGGLLEFDVPPEMLAGADLTQYGITDMDVTVSGMLAPTLSDCADGEWIVHIGDLKVTADLTLLGAPMTVVMYVSFSAGFEMAVAGNELGMGITEVKSLESEITVQQDNLIGSEPVVADLVEQNLVPALLGSLGGGQLGAFPLPELDLAGGASVAIEPTSVSRQGGNTIVGGNLK